jgi:hypothetical protein
MRADEGRARPEFIVLFNETFSIWMDKLIAEIFKNLFVF